MPPIAHRGTCCWLLPLLTSMLQAPSWCLLLSLSNVRLRLLVSHANEVIACEFIENRCMTADMEITRLSHVPTRVKQAHKEGSGTEYADAHRTDGSFKTSTD